MSKRKISDDEDDDVLYRARSKRQRNSQRDAFEGVLNIGNKALFRALRVSRGFERQKLGRRQKTAKEQNESTELVRLAKEVTALKRLDLLAIGEIHLFKALLKSQPISSAPSFPAWIAQRVKKSSSSLDPASANVTARLFNSNPVKAALETILGSVHNVLDLPADDVPRRKKRLRAANYKTNIRDQEPQSRELHQGTSEQDHSESSIVLQGATPALDAYGDGRDVNAFETESEDSDAYDRSEAYLAAGSDNDSEQEAQGVPIDKPKLSNKNRSPPHSSSASLLPSPSVSPSPPPPPISHTSVPSKPTESTTFLPTLSGGYWSGSEPSDEDGAEIEDQSVIKPRKNRRGQQERRAIWEKKFGAKAKHFQKQGMEATRSSRDDGWDPKRGASDGTRGRGRGRGSRVNGVVKGRGGGVVRSGANSDPVNGKRQLRRALNPSSGGKADEKPLHPSWEAKKKAKEKAGNSVVAFQGKKSKTTCYRRTVSPNPVPIAIIGGTGLSSLPSPPFTPLAILPPPQTPWGLPSSPIAILSYTPPPSTSTPDPKATTIAFLARHGLHHQYAPHEIPTRANVAALKKLGVTCAIGFSAVGSLKEEVKPRDFVVVDQVLDWTKGVRPWTFFQSGTVGHISMADPFDPPLSTLLATALSTPNLLQGTDITVHPRGTVICIEGPQFSTRAESLLYRSFGVSCINMSAMPEAKLFREAEIAFSLICMSTDYDSWHTTNEGVSVEMVMGHMVANGANAKRVVARVVEELSREENREVVEAERYQGMSRAAAGITKVEGRGKEAVEKLGWLFEGTGGFEGGFKGSG